MGLYEREVVVLSWNKVVEVGCAVLFIKGYTLQTAWVREHPT